MSSLAATQAEADAKKGLRQAQLAQVVVKKEDVEVVVRKYAHNPEPQSELVCLGCMSGVLETSGTWRRRLVLKSYVTPIFLLCPPPHC